MNTQIFTTDLQEAALAKYAGYDTRYLPNERQWAIQNPGDLEELFADARAGVQTIANAFAFLQVFEEMRKTQNGQFRPVAPRVAQAALGDCVELLPGKITAQKNTWVTDDFNTANLLMYRGNSLLETHLKAGRTKFTFARDEGLNEVISLFNQKKLRVDPHQWMLAGFKVRDAMRNLKGYGKGDAPWAR